jgi:hypothetical protein
MQNVLQSKAFFSVNRKNLNFFDVFDFYFLFLANIKVRVLILMATYRFVELVVSLPKILASEAGNCLNRKEIIEILNRGSMKELFSGF